MYCKNCGNKISANSEFCGFCGTKVSNSIEGESGDIKYLRTNVLSSVISFEKRIFLVVFILLGIHLFNIFYTYNSVLFSFVLNILAPSILFVYLSVGFSNRLWRRIVILLSLIIVISYIIKFHNYMF